MIHPACMSSVEHLWVFGLPFFAMVLLIGYLAVKPPHTQGE